MSRRKTIIIIVTSTDATTSVAQGVQTVEDGMKLTVEYTVPEGTTNEVAAERVERILDKVDVALRR